MQDINSDSIKRFIYLYILPFEPVLKKALSADNVGKTDQTSVSPVGGQLSKRENDFFKDSVSSPKLFLGFLYLCPGNI